MVAQIQIYTAENISESCGRVLQDLLHISRLDLLLKSPLFHAIFLFYQQQQIVMSHFPLWLKYSSVDVDIIIQNASNF